MIGTRAEADGATSVLLYGAVQREVIQARLAQDFGIETRFEPIATVYRERPAGRGEALTELDRLHGSRFWATIGLRVEPAELGAGIRYWRDVEWGSVPRAFHAATEETVRQSLQHGLCGWEIADCVITVTHFGYLQPMSTAADFRQLAPLVLRRALEQAGTRVYEPCERFEVEVPPAGVSPVLSRLAGLEAVIEETSERGRSWLITGGIPARCMQDLVASLPGLTHGEGVAWSQPGPDRPVRGAPPLRR